MRGSRGRRLTSTPRFTNQRRGGTLPCVSRSLLSLRGDAGAKDPAFASRKGGHLIVRRQWCGQAHSQEGRHQRGRITALAAPRARLACHRPGRLAARGAVDAGPRQHRHHIRLTARPTQHVGAACTWIRECSFDENRGSELMKLESAPRQVNTPEGLGARKQGQSAGTSSSFGNRSMATCG